jgi:UDPglucose 6-dehydrogenase
VGGGNLTRDLASIQAIAWRTGADAELVDAWVAQSAWRRGWALRVLHDRVLGTSPAPRLAVWGVAYKENTQSTKNSPSVALLRTLRGVDIAVFDPQARLEPDDGAHVTTASDAVEACRRADALVVMTPWPLFGTVDLRQVAAVMRGRTILDPFGCLDEAQARGAGFEYLRLGTAAAPTLTGVSC